MASAAAVRSAVPPYPRCLSKSADVGSPSAMTSIPASQRHASDVDSDLGSRVSLPEIDMAQLCLRQPVRSLTVRWRDARLRRVHVDTGCVAIPRVLVVEDDHRLRDV